MGHKWKIGDWAEYKGKRYLVYNVTCATDKYELDGVFLVSSRAWESDGHFSLAMENPLLKHLPECTGWDWKPVEKPVARELPKLLDGYRYLERDEVVAEGDLCIDRAPAGNKYDWRTAGCKSIGSTAGHRMDHYGVVCFARKIEPVAHDWKFGDWAMTRQNNIVRFVSVDDDGDHMFVDYDGNVSSFNETMLVHLPDCKNWHWTPEDPKKQIEPPPGYRIVTDGIVSDGDMSLQDRGWYYTTAKGKDIAELLEIGAAKAYARKIEEPKLVKPPDGYRLLNEGESVVKGDVYQAWDGKWIECVGCHIIPKGLGAVSTPYARKIEPRYRPFANAAEFTPYRDKWISRSEMGVAKPGAWKPIGYSDDGIYPDSTVMGYIDAFGQLKFEDGTPFGVLENSQ